MGGKTFLPRRQKVFLQRRQKHISVHACNSSRRPVTDERRCGVSVSTFVWYAVGQGSIPARTRHVILLIIRCKNLALNIRDCVSLCLLDKTLKAVGAFYLVSMPGEKSLLGLTPIAILFGYTRSVP